MHDYTKRTIVVRSIVLLAVLATCATATFAQQATKPAAKAKKPKPIEIIVEKDVEIPMRDGTILRADVQRPATGGPYPVLLYRTPYGKSLRLKKFAEAGYITVCQDTRGRYASDGEFESYYREKSHCPEDGYDTVAWCATMPNSTGVVGTLGVSYNAYTQWKTAMSAPPQLKCMAAFSIPMRHTDLEGPGTIRPMRRLQWWYSTIATDMRKRQNGPEPYEAKLANERLKSGYHDTLLHWLPWGTLPDEVLLMSEKPHILAYFRNPFVDMWHLDAGARASKAPNLNVCGWYDHCNGSIDLHTEIAEHGGSETARKESKLIVGPWSHGTLGKRVTNKFDFGPEAVIDLDATQIAWFDHYLKGIDNGVEKTAPVRIFVMGRNEWLDEPKWPLDRAKPRRMYLGSQGRANTAAGDGVLIDSPAVELYTDRYTYDPGDPVPSNLPDVGYTVPVDQRPVAGRHDVLVYQSAPLTKPLTVIGYPEVELYAATTAPDTDFIVKLVDVPPGSEAPDGPPQLEICTGIVRARYRNGPKAELVTPGEVVKYTIRMKPTAMEFQPGHRIRVQVTSSDFPSYDRNHNTAADPNFGAELVQAEQTIHHSGDRPSAVVLPVVELP